MNSWRAISVQYFSKSAVVSNTRNISFLCALGSAGYSAFFVNNNLNMARYLLLWMATTVRTLQKDIALLKKQRSLDETLLKFNVREFYSTSSPEPRRELCDAFAHAHVPD